MNRRQETRRALLRLARFRELAAMQKLAGNLVVHSEAVAKHRAEQDAYAALSAHYAQALAPGHASAFSRYEIFGSLSRAGEARLESTGSNVEATGVTVEQSRMDFSDASERRGTHEDRLQQLESELRADTLAREQAQSLETWMHTRSTP